MNFKHGRLACSLLLAGFLSACGGGNGEESTAVQSTYSGTVRDSKGAPIAGLSVALENRITDEKFTTATDENGSFSILVNQGTYDILFDDEKSTKYTTLQKTAINLKTDQDDSIQLHSAGNHSNTLFTGTVTDTSNQILAGRKLLILPSIARSTAAVGIAQVPEPIMVTTDENGSFETYLGKDGMDFDFDVLLISTNAPDIDVEKMSANFPFLQLIKENFEESLDIEKPNGAMHANIVIGSENRNLRGATGAPSVVLVDAQNLKVYEDNAPPTTMTTVWARMKTNAANALLSVIPSAYAGEMFTKFLWVPAQADANGKINGGMLVDGIIRPIYGSCKYISLAEMNNGVQAFDSDNSISALDTKFCITSDNVDLVSRTNRILYDLNYRKSPTKYNNRWLPTFTIELRTPWRGQYNFSDERGTTALRTIDTISTNYLRYANDARTIVKVEFCLAEKETLQRELYKNFPRTWLEALGCHGMLLNHEAN